MKSVSLMTLLSHRDFPEACPDVSIYLPADKGNPLTMVAFNAVLTHLRQPECRPPLLDSSTVYLSGGVRQKRDDDQIQCVFVKDWKADGMPTKDFLEELRLLRAFMDEIYAGAGCPQSKVFIMLDTGDVI